jgi:hypothetical protein
MKNSYKFLLLLLIPLFSFGFTIEDGTYTKEKSISKTFSVDSDALLQTSNSYGNINVYLWDENKISIQVNIKVSGNNENKVIEKLNSIDVAFSASTSKVSAATTFDNSNWKNGNNMNYEINYIIKIPRNGNVGLINKYGNIAIEKLNGTSNISCEYGNVNLGNFSNKSNNIILSYSGDSSIGTIEKLNLSSQYSQIDFQNVNQIAIEGNYNGFNFQNVGSLTMSSNYTKINSKSIQKFICNGNYLTLKLGEIGNIANLNSNYSDINLTASSKIKDITINGNYSNSKITCSSDLAFDIEVDIKYGGFKDQIGLKYTEKTEKNTSKKYSGYHISQGKASISVNTNYGSVQLLDN